MFESDEDFGKHVIVVFTFSDKSPMANCEEWLNELCPKLPMPQFIEHGMNSTRDELMK